MKLKAVQHAFSTAFDQLNDGADFFSVITSSSSLSATARFNIYRSSIEATLIRALQQIYPVCNKLISDEDFSKVALAYSKKFPSRSPSLDEYGEFFSEFLAGFTPLKAIQYLADVAALEWAWHRAFNAHDCTAINFSDLEKAYENEPEAIRFSLAESTTLIASNFPLLKIWQMNQENYCGDETLQLIPDNYYFLINRVGLIPEIHEIKKNDFQLLKEFENHFRMDQLSGDFGENLASFIANRWVTDFTVDGEK